MAAMQPRQTGPRPAAPARPPTRGAPRPRWPAAPVGPSSARRGTAAIVFTSGATAAAPPGQTADPMRSGAAARVAARRAATLGRRPRPLEVSVDPEEPATSYKSLTRVAEARLCAAVRELRRLERAEPVRDDENDSLDHHAAAWAAAVGLPTAAALAARVAAGRAAERNLLAAHAGLVHGLAIAASARASGTLDVGDAVGEARAVLVRAAASLDPAAGTPLAPYAAVAIKRALTSAMAARRLVAVPRRVTAARSALAAARDALDRAGGAPAAPAAVAAAAGVSSATAWAALAAGRAERGLDAYGAATAADGDAPPTEDDALAAAADAPGARGARSDDPDAAWWAAAAEASLAARVRDLLAALPPAEAAAVALRYGLDGNGPRSYPEVGAALGASGEAVRTALARRSASLAAGGAGADAVDALRAVAVDGGRAVGGRGGWAAAALADAAEGGGQRAAAAEAAAGGVVPAPRLRRRRALRPAASPTGRAGRGAPWLLDGAGGGSAQTAARV